MWVPRYEDFPNHRQVVNWYRDGKPSSWSEPPYLWPKFKAITQQLLTLCPPPAKVLDVGCYTGYFLRHLVAHGYSGIGVDLQQDLMRGLHGTVGQDGPLDFRFASCENVADHFLAESFDAVCLVDVLEHVLDEERALSAVGAVCKAGGVILLHLPREDRGSDEHLRDYASRSAVEALGRRWRTSVLHEGVDELGRATWLLVARK